MRILPDSALGIKWRFVRKVCLNLSAWSSKAYIQVAIIIIIANGTLASSHAQKDAIASRWLAWLVYLWRTLTAGVANYLQTLIAIITRLNVAGIAKLPPVLTIFVLSDNEYLKTPQSQTVSEGDIVTLQCVHKFGSSYMWRSNRRNITKSDDKVT